MTSDPAPHAITDDDLLARIVAGDRAAFAELFRRRRKDVYGFALHMTGVPAMAEDVAQDVFVAVMHDATRYQPGRSGVATWLCGIARNMARQRLDRERRFLPLGDEAAQGEELLPSVQPDPVGDLTRAEGVERVRSAVLTLPLHYREALVLCDLQELTYAEAAEAIGCAVGTVRSRLHRGRELLATKLATPPREERTARATGKRCLA